MALVVGQHYRLNFSTNIGKIKIPTAYGDPNLSKEFIRRYGGTSWASHNGKLTVVLPNQSQHWPWSGDPTKFYFVDDEIDCFAIISDFHFESINICQCNLWLSGCNCGVFKQEQDK